jgi:hypothetical protein
MADDSAKKKIEEVNKELGYIEDALYNIAESLSDSIKKAISDIKDESLKIADIFQKDLQKSIKSVAKESNNILSNQLKIAQGTAKARDINKQLLNSEIKRNAIKRALNNLEKNGIPATAETLALEKAASEELDNQQKILKSQLEDIKRINKNLGLTGSLLKGISKIPILGDLIDAEEALAAAQAKAAEEGSSRTKVMGAAFKQLGKSLFTNLTDPLVAFGVFIKGLKMLVSYGNEYSKSIYEISKNQAINYNYARLEAQRLMDASVASKEILATQQNFVKATNELNDALGVANMYSSKQLEDYTNLTQKLGLTTDEASAYASFSAMSGRSAEDIVNSVAKQTKGNLSNKKVIQEVAKVSGQLYAQYKGNPENIAKAVVQTQKLGMSLQQAQNVARGLLNFEDSITNELEAELLTGKNLNLEKARYLALQGDSAGAAEEIARQVGGLSEFTKLNVIQQEALAKAAGMGVDEFTDTLRKKQEINKLDQSQAKLYQEEIKKAKEAGDIEKATALEKAMFGRKDFELSKVELDNAAEAQARFEKASNAFKSGIAPIMEQLSRFLLKLTDFLNNPFIASLLKVAGFGLAGITAVAGIGGIVGQIKNLFGKGKVQDVRVVNQGPGGGGEGTDSGNLGFGGAKSSSFLKKLTSPKSMIKSLARAGGASFAPGAKGVTARTLGRGLMKGAGKFGGNALGKVFGGSGVGSVLGAVKDQFDFFADEKTRGTGAGGWLESLGGSGMSLIDWIPGINQLTEATGLGINNMDTDNLANARAIYRKLHPDSSTIIPNKELIADIRANPQGYTEDIISDQEDVDIETLKVGGLVTRGGLAKVDTGEMYLGANSITVLKNMLDAMQEQNKYLLGILNKEGHVYLDSTKVGTALTVGTSRIQ